MLDASVPSGNYCMSWAARLFRDAHDRGFWPQPLAVAWDQRPVRRTRRAFLHLQYSREAPRGPAGKAARKAAWP